MRLIRFRWPKFLGLTVPVLVLLGLVLLGCRSVAPEPGLRRFTYAELYMATAFRIVLYAPDPRTADRAAELAFTRIGALEDIMSDYDPQSELMRLCRQPAGVPHPVSPDLFAVLAQAQTVSKRTGGAFDVTVGPMVQLWRTARKTRILPDAAQIETARQAVGYEKMRLDPQQRTVTLTVPGMRLDLGGIAKGLAAHQALAVLHREGIDRAMVAAGGDIALGDPPPGRRGWAIGISSIDHPEGGVTQEAVLRNSGVSTSGDTEQYVEIKGRRYSHIVDPQTGLGLTERIGVTVIAPSATTSDSLATAVSVLGAERGLALIESWPKTAALIVRLAPDGKKVIESRQFKKLAPANAPSGSN